MRRTIQFTLVLDRQVALIIGAAIGLLLIGMIGVSAHAGARPILQLAGVHESETDGVTSGVRSDGDKATEAVERNDPNEKSESESTSRTRPTATPSDHGGEGSAGGD